jgi:hypothetical protein
VEVRVMNARHFRRLSTVRLVHSHVGRVAFVGSTTLISIVAFSTAAWAVFSTVSSLETVNAITASVLNAPGTGSVGTPTQTTLPLSWIGSSGLPSGGGYIVLRSTTSGGPFTAVGTGTCSGLIAVNSCTDTSLASSTTYYYEVESAFDLWRSPTNVQFIGTTNAAGSSLPFTSNTPGTYQVSVPANHAVTLTNICGGAGGGGATSSGGKGGGGGCVAGTIPSQPVSYTLTVVIGAGGTAAGGGGTGFNTGGTGATTGPGGGGGGSSALQVGATTVVIAAGGGGGSAYNTKNAGAGGSGGIGSPIGAAGTGTEGGGGGGTGNGIAAVGGNGTTGTAAGGGGGGAGANPGAGGNGTGNLGSSHSAVGGGAGGDLVIATGVYAFTATYTAGSTTGPNTTGASGSVSLF